MRIEDGKGRGNAVAVNDHQQLSIYSVVESEQHFVNESTNETYSVLFSQTPSTGALFGFIKNTSTTNMLVPGMKADTNGERIQVKLGDGGTPTDGSAITAVNHNAGSNKIADATIQAGNNITGLSGGGVVDDIFFASGDSSLEYVWDSLLIIPKNQMISFYAVNGSIPIKATVAIYFHNPDDI